jgi:hypothetical protein
MPTTYTSSNRLNIQGIGENANTWGAIANTDRELLDNSLDGIVDITLSTVTVSLTANSGAVDQARNRILRVSGSVATTIDVVIPSVYKWYIIDSTLTGAGGMRLLPSGGNGLFVQGEKKVIAYTDGTDFYEVLSDSSDGLFENEILTQAPPGTDFPQYHFKTSTASNNQAVGALYFDAFNSVATTTTYGFILGRIVNSEDSNESGRLEVYVETSGAVSKVMDFGGDAGVSAPNARITSIQATNIKATSIATSAINASTGSINNLTVTSLTLANPVCFTATKTNSTSHSGTGNQTVIYNSELIDIGSYYSTVTGFFTAPPQGRYYINANVDMAMSGAASASIGLAIYVGGALYAQSKRSVNITTPLTYNVQAIVSVNGAENVDIRSVKDQSVNLTITQGQFSGQKVF